MDSNDTQTSAEETSAQNGNGELSHSDKMIGIFTEPAKTFENVSRYPLKSMDWFLPILILMLVAGLMQRISMMNEEVYFEVMKKQTEAIQKQVEAGNLTQEQADQQIEATETFMQGPIGWVTTIAGALIVGFIIFFFISLIYWACVKLFLKGEGGYTNALVAGGLTAYITILQMLITGILTFLFGTLVKDTSLAALLETERTTYAGWALAKIDPINIWSYIVLSIGLTKLFKSQNTGKYYVLVFSLWIVGGFLLFQLAKSVPFLESFIQ